MQSNRSEHADGRVEPQSERDDPGRVFDSLQKRERFAYVAGRRRDVFSPFSPSCVSLIAW